MSVEMRTVKEFWHVLLVAVAFVVAYYFFGIERANNLTFIERDSPEGFRELVLDKRSSSFNPLLGIKLNARSSELGDQQRSSDLNVCEALYRDPTSPVVGDHESEVTIVEFFDYRCPYCKILEKILSQAQFKYRLRVVYKEWPILGKSSELAARAALAADKQGRYQEFHTKLMRSRFIPTVGYIDNLVAGLGMDRLRLSRDMASNETTLALRRTSALAKELGFFSTPYLVVGRTIVQGAVTRAELESLIEIEASSELPCLY